MRYRGRRGRLALGRARGGRGRLSGGSRPHTHPPARILLVVWDSLAQCVFMVFGFPLGVISLDILMFLEPFGLLALLPFPERLRTFVPAYKATRLIAEVFVESLPQCLLQSFIYVRIITRAESGAASPSEMAMLAFVAALPKSILISTVAIVRWCQLDPDPCPEPLE